VAIVEAVVDHANDHASTFERSGGVVKLVGTNFGDASVELGPHRMRCLRLHDVRDAFEVLQAIHRDEPCSDRVLESGMLLDAHQRFEPLPSHGAQLRSRFEIFPAALNKNLQRRIQLPHTTP
jgi:hypothetical protein